ncbi:hypothetical protein [Chengkuizengella sediminis]|uniref:hypothetical protein n=1 Tax=Chengkuizengella sediminis TaxID=1885917 RepID=UPI001389400A|nr:hypothetical protein [Chengkuizengella sediminis]NDI35633.1 hypothetical protein [Chengkuizengella sediminis]
MSIFGDTKCDCCVCPMQCVLEQLVGEEVSILIQTTNPVSQVINEVNDFIVFTSQGNYPICNVVAVFVPMPSRNLRLKPIKKNVGECSCCEAPMTNVLKLLKGKDVFVETLGIVPNILGTVTDVGEGIAVVTGSGTSNFPTVISTCAITRVIQS